MVLLSNLFWVLLKCKDINYDLKMGEFYSIKLYFNLKSELGWERRSIEGEIKTLLDFLMLKNI